MKSIGGLTAGAVLSALVLSPRFGREVWLGMFAPLLVVSITWVVIERVHRAAPERLTAVAITGFAGKLVFFGAYVAVVVGLLKVDLAPFALSLAGYFIVLHIIEALWMKRLLVS